MNKLIAMSTSSEPRPKWTLDSRLPCSLRHFEALNADMVAANNDDAIWLLDGFVPGPAAAGVSATAKQGAAPYPMLPQIGLLHNALGAELSDFLKGDESAEQALMDVEAAYTTAAKEAGFL